MDVRSLVVMLQKLFALELEVVKRLVPNAAPIIAPGVRFESDERLGSIASRFMREEYPLISGNFGDLKVLGRGKPPREMAGGHKYGVVKQQHDWVKCHIMCGVKTNSITAVKIHGRNTHDAPLLPALVQFYF